MRSSPIVKKFSDLFAKDWFVFREGSETELTLGEIKRSKSTPT